MEDDEPIVLKSHERLVGIQRDRHVRKQGGQYLAYIVTEKSRAHCLLGQKLCDIAGAIATITKDKSDRVSIAGLFKCASNYHGGGSSMRTGGWMKHRWHVRPIVLEKAVDTFESIRHEFDRALVVGKRDRYSIACV